MRISTACLTARGITTVYVDELRCVFERMYAFQPQGRSSQPARCSLTMLYDRLTSLGPQGLLADQHSDKWVSDCQDHHQVGVIRVLRLHTCSL